MSEPFIGEIKLFAGNFAPRGWAFCSGQLLPIAPHTALFSILGTFYGGNGQTTFALPNLQSRSPMHQGQGPGLSQRVIGEEDGRETVTLLAGEMPSHSHLPIGVADPGSQTTPGNALWAASTGGGRTPPPLYQNTTNTTMRPDIVSFAGSGQPHNNLQPYLALSFVIALEGIFPSRA